MSQPTDERPSVKACHVCEGTRIYYLFSASAYRVVRCEDCGLVFLNPQPNDTELARIYGANYFLGSESEEGRRAAGEVKQATAAGYLSEIARYRGSPPGRLLEVGCGDGDFLEVAEKAGWNVTGIEYSASASERARQRLKKGQVHCGELRQASLPAEQFDLCVLSDVLEHVRAPLEFLREIHRVLKPGGTLFVATPSTDSWSARLLRQKWMEFKAEHLTYFDRQTLQTALFKSGFREVIVQPGWKVLSLDYVRKHFERFPVPGITPSMNFLARFLPKGTRERHRRIVASGIMAFARKAEVRPQPVLSVIVPAYNEAKTFDVMMEGLLRKELPTVRMEIIVVESNSTDGTRETVLKYKDHPKVKLIFEDQPRGKGHAVRTGLKAASGDYVLIQDADLEYDLEDYDALLDQLVTGRSAFVLGSRHGGRKVLKMRRFTGQHGLSLFVNVGHWFFTTLVNVLFLQRLRDPFTMFKVFRRDCLFGLEFQCNRFDFDYELLIKLIRKGYRPIELPVNYRSRSYKEGKKVRMFRDPLSWLGTLAWLRRVKIDPMAVAERQRRTGKAEVS
ncbi:MAG TPA: methyltransferase domain-containing protein [Verrucomicrobiae bacterium]|jgi:SAM-dependent methyltransferase|nr:methyltransferase domain-containing protein [Verrucomicrobiae bacterium]